MSEPAWDWVVAAYRRDGVQALCLDLQDRWGQCVPLLLTAAWAAGVGRPFQGERLEAAIETARAWSDVVVSPLRSLRRTLKAAVPDIDDVARLAVREQVKAVELEAERRLILALEAIALEVEPAGASSASGALTAVAHAWARVLPRAELADLAARLSP